MLALEIELLTGVYRAALPDNSPEWPPHPERVFSALVQAWGDGGCDAKERAALRWLEALPAPSIEADQHELCGRRAAPIVYVPPNDSRGDKVSVLPERRPRQARNFQVTIPSNSFVRLIWQASPSREDQLSLIALARRVVSLGHSASLVRFAFTEIASTALPLWTTDDRGDTNLRVTYRGRLRRLEDWLSKNERPQTESWKLYRSPQPRVSAPIKQSVFGSSSDWFVFEDIGGARPDMLAFAHVAKCVRDKLMSYGPQPPPEIISGHAADGSRSTTPHIAIVPLANVGWTHSTGDLLGFAVVLPRGLASEDRSAVIRALAAFAHVAEDDGGHVDLPVSESVCWYVARAPTPSRTSLKPERWCSRADSWASCTPILLDRFPDREDPAALARLIATSCRNIQLPEPLEIEIHKHSSVTGAPSTYPARGIETRPDWSFPPGSKLTNRMRRHVVLRFAEPVEGPVLIGAGRYYGFGLCLPLG